MPVITPGVHSYQAFGTQVRLIKFKDHDYTVALDTEGTCVNMVHLLDPSKPHGQDDVVMSGGHFDPETGKVSLVWPDGVRAEELNEDVWDDGMIPLIEEAVQKIRQIKIDMEATAKHDEGRLPAIACAVAATAALDKIAAGDESGRTELADLMRRQIPTASGDRETSEPMREALAQWVAAPDLDVAREAVDDILLPVAKLFSQYLRSWGMKDPSAVFKKIAETPARRAALIRLLGIESMSASLVMQNPAEYIDMYCVLTNAGDTARQLLIAGASQVFGGTAIPVGIVAPKAVAGPLVAAGPAPVSATNLDAPYRDVICRAIDDGDPNEVAAFTSILIAMELPTLRADCLRASCELDAQKRAELVEALRERLYHASGERDAMVDVEDVMSGKVPVYTP